MLQNAYLLAKIGADTAENEQHFAENLQKNGNYPTEPRVLRVGEDAVERGLRVPAAGRVLGRRVPPAGEPAPL